jgi:hypothetical protein
MCRHPRHFGLCRVIPADGQDNSLLSQMMACGCNWSGTDYLTPAKRRRIKRRGQRSYLERAALGYYGIALAAGESTKSLRARCLDIMRPEPRDCPA